MVEIVFPDAHFVLYDDDAKEDFESGHDHFRCHRYCQNDRLEEKNKSEQILVEF